MEVELVYFKINLLKFEVLRDFLKLHFSALFICCDQFDNNFPQCGSQLHRSCPLSSGWSTPLSTLILAGFLFLAEHKLAGMAVGVELLLTWNIVLSRTFVGKVKPFRTYHKLHYKITSKFHMK